MRVEQMWIRGWHPTPLNKLIGCHRMAADRRKKADAKMIAGYAALGRLRGELTPAKGKRRVRLEIVLGKGQRMCDPDAYSKSLLDALVHAELLKDDRDRYCRMEPVTFARAKEWGTLIQLEEME